MIIKSPEQILKDKGLIYSTTAKTLGCGVKVLGIVEAMEEYHIQFENTKHRDVYVGVDGMEYDSYSEASAMSNLYLGYSASNKFVVTYEDDNKFYLN